MMANRTGYRLSLVVTIVAVSILCGVSLAYAATAPIKEILTSHIGWEVGKALPGKICTVASEDECRRGKPSAEAGGFEFAKGVAGGPAPENNVYVADAGNNRVQELTATGEFVSMFGKHVNETTGGDVCSEIEIEKGSRCEKGEEGQEAGALSSPEAIAVDPVSGNVYISEPSQARVDEYTAAGKFVLMIGRDVNETKEKEGAAQPERNICTEAEIETSGVKCQAGESLDIGVIEHSGFVQPDVLAVGPTNHLLYVGDEHSVQEFEADGKYVGALREPLEAISHEPRNYVTALAVDTSDNVYLVYDTVCDECGAETGVQHTEVIREFDPSGKESKRFRPKPRESLGNVIALSVLTLALDPAGRLAVTEVELDRSKEDRGVAAVRGVLYEEESQAKSESETFFAITEFNDPSSSSIAFNGDEQLYAVAEHEIVAYIPSPVAQLATQPASCTPGREVESDATFNCVLNGEANPWGISGTEIFFEWGETQELGGETAVQDVPTGSTPASISAELEGVRPNEPALHYRLVGHDQVVKSPEELTSRGLAALTTPTVPPKMVGSLSVSFVKSASAVMFAEINPENAATKYEFQYGPCEDLESCPGRAATPVQESSVYGKIGTTVEVSGLQPGTVYHYRLVAESENAAKSERQQSVGIEDSFTTAMAPVPQAVTGAASAIGTTSATVSGTVDPDGQPATYSFELGVYAGDATQYGVVFSGPAGASSVPVEQSLALTGLQPGTTYAYRISTKSGYGVAEGTPGTFTTAGLPVVLNPPSPLPMLTVPKTSFPKSPATPKKKSRKIKKKHATGGKGKKRKKKPRKGKK